METQPILSQIETETPMAPSKPSKASRRSTPWSWKTRLILARRHSQEAAWHAAGL